MLSGRRVPVRRAQRIVEPFSRIHHFGWVGRRLYHLRREIRLKILVVADFFSFLDKTIDGSSTTWS